MKLVTAVIRPEKLNQVKDALDQQGIGLMTVTDVRGCGSQGGRTEVYRGQEYSVLLIPKVKIEIAVNDEFLELAIEAIKTSAKSGSEGKIGDGKIFVQELNDCIRIRTGDKGSDAIGP